MFGIISVNLGFVGGAGLNSPSAARLNTMSTNYIQSQPRMYATPALAIVNHDSLSLCYHTTKPTER